TSQIFDGTASVRATRADTHKAVWDTNIATAIESRTSQRLYVPTKARLLRDGPPWPSSATIGVVALRLEVRAVVVVIESANYPPACENALRRTLDLKSSWRSRCEPGCGAA